VEFFVLNLLLNLSARLYALAYLKSDGYSNVSSCPQNTVTVIFGAASYNFAKYNSAVFSQDSVAFLPMLLVNSA
jgi:vancomycin permeability regulator SanA